MWWLIMLEMRKNQTPTTQIVIFFGFLQIIGLLLNLKVSAF